MYIYLKFGTEPSDVKVVSNVKIGEDCEPIVNGRVILNSAKSEDSSNSIDAIGWFKSLPMQAVYIDCSTRDARWCLKSVTIPDCNPVQTVQLRRSNEFCYVDMTTSPDIAHRESAEECAPFMPKSARLLFSEHAGMSDFNPIIDEMFEHVERLCLQWETLTESGEINNEVARILHCYVFPAVTFLRDDVPVLQECLRLIVVKHENINREIMTKKKNIDITDKYLARLKEVILAQEEMNSQSYLQACNAEFVGMFYTQVTKDIQKNNMNLDLLQTKINELKKSSPDGDQLNKLKEERDDLYTSMQKLLIVREAIRNHLYRPFLPKNKRSKNHRTKINEKDASLHTNFQTVYQQLVTDKDYLKQLCYRKLHLSSVREAFESTLRTLQREHSTSFGDFTEFSINPSIEGGIETSWQSMQAAVDGWMRGEGSLQQQHTKGCQMIVDVIESMLSDSRMPLMGVVDADHTSENQTRCGYEGDISADVSCQRAPVVKAIRIQALTHMLDVARNIVLRMNLDASPESRHINRAWMCYDPHFWTSAGEAIEKIYTHYHARKAREIHRQVSSAALADIMDSHFFKKFFLGAGVSSEPDQGNDSEERDIVGRFKSQDSLSALSLDLQRCSVTDLYALANRDGAKVNCHMMDLEDLLASSPAESVGFEHSSGVSKGDHSSGENLMAGDSRESDASGESGFVIISAANSDENDAHHDQSSASCSPGSSDQSARDLGGTDNDNGRAEATTVRSSQTVSSVLGIFSAVVEPYHLKVQQVLTAPNLMEKMRAVWKSVDFLSKKTQEVCKDKGMDSLLPMSIFATASFPEDLFVRYFIQLLILLDFKPSFALHSIYDFSLSSAISTFMFMFEARFSASDQSCLDSD
ncbi:hypothetical protein ACOMHN_043266 [Nucella lapillus]